eukprot:12418704-Karenia_brevis.AAC.1
MTSETTIVQTSFKNPSEIHTSSIQNPPKPMQSPSKIHSKSFQNQLKSTLEPVLSSKSLQEGPKSPGSLKTLE